MSKKLLASIMVIGVLVSFAGCSSSNEVQSPSGEVEESTETIVETGEEETEEVKTSTDEEEGTVDTSEEPVEDTITRKDLKKMFPDPYDIFSGIKFEYVELTDSDDMQSFCVSGVTLEDYEKYVSKCRSTYGFTDVSISESDYYIARNEELPTRLEVYYTEFEDEPEKNYILVSVSKVSD